MNDAIRELNRYIITAQKELDYCLTMIPPDKECVRTSRLDVEQALSDRVDFWRNTFRKEPDVPYEADAYGLWIDYGCKFTAPTLAEIRDVLETLDKKYPGWDLKSAEPFYATLEGNYPGRVKQERKGKRRNKSIGCLSALLVLLFIVVVTLSNH